MFESGAGSPTGTTMRTVSSAEMSLQWPGFAEIQRAACPSTVDLIARRGQRLKDTES